MVYRKALSVSGAFSADRSGRLLLLLLYRKKESLPPVQLFRISQVFSAARQEPAYIGIGLTDAAVHLKS